MPIYKAGRCPVCGHMGAIEKGKKWCTLCRAKAKAEKNEVVCDGVRQWKVAEFETVMIGSSLAELEWLSARSQYHAMEIINANRAMFASRQQRLNARKEE